MFDVLFVGGGLSASLSAYLLREKNPKLKILVLEASGPLDHLAQTWSFQTLPAEADPSPFKTFSKPESSWLNSFISQSWSGYDISFPRYQKHFAVAYHSIRSHSFHAAIRSRLAESIRYYCRAEKIGKTSVTTAAGEVLEARIVLDARGWTSDIPASGYQKFIGLNLKLKQAHGLKNPLLMDATVKQEDGFRFFYLLPWSSHEVLIEDTRYSNSPALDDQAIEAEILRYAERMNFQIESIDGKERGSLALPGFDSSPLATPLGSLGVRAGFYHPTTGYSVYEAVQTAESISLWAKDDLLKIPAKLKEAADQRYRAQEFYRRLNNMMFHAAEPLERYRILERFYEHDADLIGRFYAGKTSMSDKLRIMSGKPPIAMQKAIYHFFNRSDALREVTHA